jgi:phenylacetate-CoA ligase
VVGRILGRKRNMIKLPDGSSHWPSFPYKDWAEGIAIKQFQLVQSRLDAIEVKIVAAETITTEQEKQMRLGLQARLGFPFEIGFSYVEHIPRSKGGKYEDFVSLVV